MKKSTSNFQEYLVLGGALLESTYYDLAFLSSREIIVDAYPKIDHPWHMLHAREKITLKLM
jgi:hypothetical protein